MIRPFFLFLFLLVAMRSFAGGPLYVSPTGSPAHWATMPIALHPESGDCGQFSNSEMISRLDDNLAYWAAVPDIDLSFDIVEGEVSSDITAENFSDTADSESSDLHPIVFDSDGSIIEDLFGQSSQYYFLGFAGFTEPNDDEGVIESGLALFNCLCIENADDCPSAVPESELDATIVHEMGHFIGLDHTAVNEDLVNAPCDADLLGDCDTVPIMYPTTFDAGETLQLQTDDKLAALALYGESGWDASYCTITGSLVDAEGNPLRCADVQAVSDDSADTVSFVSGYLAEAEDGNNDGDTVDSGECTADCGDFILRLDPSKSYTITVKPLTETWIDASSVGPCKNEQLSGVIQEDVGTITGCTAGDTQDLGVLQTQSTEGTSGTDSTDTGSDDTGSTSNCGSGQDFSDCDELISCSLNKTQQKSPMAIPANSLVTLTIIYIGFFYFLKQASLIFGITNPKATPKSM